VAADKPATTTVRRSRTRWHDALLAPARHLLNPSEAAMRMLGASRPVLWFTLICWCAVLFLVPYPAWFWADSVEIDSSFWQPSGRAYLKYSSLADIWSRWSDNSNSLMTFQQRVQVGWLLIVALVLFLGLPMLPAVVASDGVKAAYNRGVRVVLSGMGFLSILIALAALAGAWLDNHRDQVVAAAGGTVSYYDVQSAVAGLIFAALGAQCVWWGYASDGAGRSLQRVETTPRCEGCGYDLTHVPDDRRCSECGLAIDLSLHPKFARPGCEWNSAHGLNDWAMTTTSVLLGPRAFFRQVRLRESPRDARAFAWTHFGLLGIACGVVGFGYELCDQYVRVFAREGGLAGTAFLFATMIPFLAWVVQRLVAAMVCGVWAVRRTIPDVGWMRVVVAWETPFVWFVALWNTLLGCSFALFGSWVTRLLGFGFLPRGSLPALAEFDAVVFSNLAWLLIWFWRYRLIGRAIRWANF
jgi:hypothetical protein